jgi:hypothetical protein
MFAGFEGGDHHIGREAVRGTDEHRVDVGPDDGLIIGVELDAFESAPRRSRIRRADQDRIVIFFDGLGPDLAHLSEADDSYAQWLGHWLSVL